MIQGLNLTNTTSLSTANETALKSMKSGLAKLSSVLEHIGKKSGNKGIKLVFDAIASGCQGHDEYISFSRPNDYQRVMSKLRYLFVHANNEDAKKLYESAQSMNPFQVITVVENGNAIPLTWTDKNSKDTQIALHGEQEGMKEFWDDIDPKDKSKGRICYAVKDSDNQEAILQALLSAFKAIEGSIYMLEIREPQTELTNAEKLAGLTKIPRNKQFQGISTIKPNPLAS
jgi:hypothetical protein